MMSQIHYFGYSKDSVDSMNLIGFFIVCGRGKNGRIDKYTIVRELGIALLG